MVEYATKLKVVNKGRKRVSSEMLWKKNLEKAEKDRGLDYKTYKGYPIGKKTFNRVTECCTKSCYTTVPYVQQHSFFSSFYQCGDKNTQDNIIANSLIPMPSKKSYP